MCWHLDLIGLCIISLGLNCGIRFYHFGLMKRRLKKIERENNNWKTENRLKKKKKKRVGSDFLLIDITHIFYIHEKSNTYCHGNRLVPCQVLLIHIRYIGDDLPLSLGTHHIVLGLAFCIMIMIPSNVHLVGSSNNVLVVSDFTCWYLVQVFLHCFGHLAVY